MHVQFSVSALGLCYPSDWQIAKGTTQVIEKHLYFFAIYVIIFSLNDIIKIFTKFPTLKEILA